MSTKFLVTIEVDEEDIMSELENMEVEVEEELSQYEVRNFILGFLDEAPVDMNLVKIERIEEEDENDDDDDNDEENN